ncbi:MAG: type II toxin-antitoxin system RelE/ParE family toxin [Bacteroidales bacterium]|nr:type II toxin-antitoxin system RelE/ParE family toxin [Bacteroidales bacterium]
MRTILKSQEYEDFYGCLDQRTQEKIKYILQMMTDIRVINTKFVKKLENTDFYEIRISSGVEYRILLYTLDKDSFIESNQVLLLNGFVKKSTKDYNRSITIADSIIARLSETNDSNNAK